MWNTRFEWEMPVKIVGLDRVIDGLGYNYAISHNFW